MTRQVFTAVRLPKFMFLDPVSRSIVTAPADIEPLTLEEGQALDRAEVWPRKNGGWGIPHEEILAEFALTIDDFSAKENGA